ncbi:MAG: hypothetical protein E7493_07035 [Ruminococcus albus]|nr:hypothetical protein [Ruminococcus albus]
MKKLIAFITALCLACGVLAGCADSAGKDTSSTDSSVDPASNSSDGETNIVEDVELPEGYNQLQEITVFGFDAPLGSGIPALEEAGEGEYFPSVTLDSGSMTILLRDWAVTNLSAYVPDGYISLEVKGDYGGETFKVGFDELKNGNVTTSTISTEGIVDVTTEWMEVNIPISKISEETGTDLTHARQFVIGNPDAPIHVRNIIISSPDKEKSYPEFKVNQLGYKPASQKRAIVSGFGEELTVKSGDTFELVDKNSGEAVYSSELALITAYDMSYSGEKMLCADFSDYDGTGTYYLRMADGSIDDSLSFEINDNVYDELLANTMRYYYYQRANTDITEEYGGEFVRSDKTPKDFTAPLSSDRDTLLDVSGGWYDAGDVGKYVCPGATAANTLLWAYKLFPEKFSDSQNNIPESGNGIPDILDEVRVELDFILKMQDKDSGGFYLKVKSKTENDGDGDRTVWNGDGDKCLTNATADCSAVLAFASTIYKEFDAAYADTLLTAAESGWEYIEANPDVYTQTTYSGENNSSSSFWASACLYYATGEQKYNDYFVSNADSYLSTISSGSNSHNVGNMGIYGYFTYMLCDDKDSGTVDKITEKYSGWRDAIITTYESNPWNIAIYDWSFWWGSFNIILGNSQDMLIGDTVMGIEHNDNLTQDAVNFILGVNAQRKCYITGMGEDPIKCTFSNFYNGNSKDGFPSGYMPGGINNYNGGIISRFPLKCYTDDPGDWFTNENAIYWNAVMVFNTAALS